MRSSARLLSFLLILLISLTGRSLQAPPLSPQATKIYQRIQKKKPGADLTIVMNDATEYHGALWGSDATHLELDEVDQQQRVSLPYNDIHKVLTGYGGYNSISGQRVHYVRSLVLVGVISAGFIAILAVALANDK